MYQTYKVSINCPSVLLQVVLKNIVFVLLHPVAILHLQHDWCASHSHSLGPAYSVHHQHSPWPGNTVGIVSRYSLFFQVSFNLTTAACFSPKTAAQINLFLEWPAFQESGADGFCFDNHGEFLHCLILAVIHICRYRVCTGSGLCFLRWLHEVPLFFSALSRQVWI